MAASQKVKNRAAIFVRGNYNYETGSMADILNSLITLRLIIRVKNYPQPTS